MKTRQKSRRQSTRNPKQDIYERVTARILEQLDRGVAPWKSPHFARVGFPKNFHSGKPYQGCNILLLGLAGYVSPYFVTYLQAQERGGHVRKGEKGYLMIKWGEYKKKSTDLASGAEAEESRSYLKGYTLFNACQIEGVDFPEVALPEFTPSERVARAEAIVANMPQLPEIREGRGVGTCYHIGSDIVDIPHRAYFGSEEQFYESLFHELVHATGAAERLARPTLMENKGRLAGDSKKNYGKEELVAEIGAAFLMAHAGIVVAEHEDNASYLAGWLDILKVKQHKRWIIEAASQAQKAVAFILGDVTPSS